MNPKIFVVSLLRSEDRRAYVERQMARCGLEFEFFDAVDGGRLSEDELNKVYDEAAALADYGKVLRLGEVGCALSHYRLYEKIINENMDRMIILEDDAAIDDDFLGVLANRHKYPKDAELIYYYHGKAKSFPWNRKKIYGDYKMVRYRVPSKKSKRSITNTGAYEVTQAGARKILACAYPIRNPVDIQIGYLQRNGVVAYGVEPCCVKLAGFDSTILGRNNQK